MSDPTSTVLAADVALLPTLAEVERRQQEELIARVAAGRTTLVVGPLDPPLPVAIVEAAQRFERATAADVLDGEADVEAEAILVLDDVAGADAVAFAGWLRGRVSAGARAVVAADPALAGLLSPLLPEAVTVHQHVVDLAWLAIADAGASGQAVEVELPPTTAPRRVLLVIGADDAVDDARPEIAAGAHAVWSAELVRANTRLRQANARLSASGAAHESAAAAAVQGRALLLQQQVDELKAARTADLERLEVEVDIARHNDTLFQDARQIIELRDREIAGLRATLGRPSHRAAASAAWRLGRLPGGSRLGRLFGRLLGRR